MTDKPVLTVERHLLELSEKATPGPWRAFISDYGDADEGRPGTMFVTEDVDNDDGLFLDGMDEPTAELVATTRNALPALAAVVAAARAVDVTIHNNGPLRDSIGAESGWAYERIYPEVDDALSALRDALSRLDEVEKVKA